MEKLTYKKIIEKLIIWNFTSAPTIFTKKGREKKYTRNFLWLVPLINTETQQLEIYLAIQKDPRNYKSTRLIQHKLETITFKQQKFDYNVDLEISKFISFYKDPTYDQSERFEIKASNFDNVFLSQLKKLHQLISKLYQSCDTSSITKPITQKVLTYKIQLQERYGENKINIRIDNNLKQQYEVPTNKKYLPLFVVLNDYTIPSNEPWMNEPFTNISANGLPTFQRYLYLTSTPNKEIAKKTKAKNRETLQKNINRKRGNGPASKKQIETLQKIFETTYNKQQWFKDGKLPEEINKSSANDLLTRILYHNQIGLTIKQHYFLSQRFKESEIKNMTKKEAFEIIRKIHKDETT
jgi:hypothetical protein